MFGAYEFLPSNEMMVNGGKYLCNDESMFQEVCANVLFLVGGYNSKQLNRTLIPAILEYTPAGKDNSFNWNRVCTNLDLGIFRSICQSMCSLCTRS